MSTWRYLGLSVALGYTAFGTLGLTRSTLAAQLFNLYPQSVNVGSSKNAAASVIEDPEKAHADSISTSMILLGARDLSIGVTLLTFYYNEDAKALGTLIMGGMVLCAADVVYIWRLRGKEWGGAFAAGAASWAVIGLGLLEYI